MDAYNISVIMDTLAEGIKNKNSKIFVLEMEIEQLKKKLEEAKKDHE